MRAGRAAARRRARPRRAHAPQSPGRLRRRSLRHRAVAARRRGQPGARARARARPGRGREPGGHRLAERHARRRAARRGVAALAALAARRRAGRRAGRPPPHLEARGRRRGARRAFLAAFPQAPQGPQVALAGAAARRALGDRAASDRLYARALALAEAQGAAALATATETYVRVLVAEQRGAEVVALLWKGVDQPDNPAGYERLLRLRHPEQARRRGAARLRARAGALPRRRLRRAWPAGSCATRARPASAASSRA